MTARSGGKSGGGSREWRLKHKLKPRVLMGEEAMVGDEGGADGVVVAEEAEDEAVGEDDGKRTGSVYTDSSVISRIYVSILSSLSGLFSKLSA